MLGLAIVLIGLGYLLTLTVNLARDAVLRERVAVAYARQDEIARDVRGLFDLMRPTGLAVAATLADNDLTAARAGLDTLLRPSGTFAAVAVLHADRGVILTAGDDALARSLAGARRGPLLAGMGDQAFDAGTDRAQLGLASPISIGRDEYWIATVVTAPSLRQLLIHDGADQPYYTTEILDGSGNTVASTNAVRPDRSHADLVRHLIQERRAGAVFHKLPSGDHGHYVAYVPMPAPAGWGLLIEQPRDMIVTLPLQTRRWVIVFGVAVLGAGALIAWMDVRRVTAPLLILSDAAQRIARGDLATPVRVGGADEIGTLGRAFDEMRVHLQRSRDDVAERQRQSEALHAVSTLVLSMRERDRVLAEIAAHARGLLRRDVAVICLVDPAGRSVRAAAASGPPQAYRASARGDAVSEVAHAYALVTPEFGAGRMAAPLTVGGEVTGWLSVASRAPVATLTGDAEQLLAGLANLASLAVENARLQEDAQSAATWRERERLSRELHDGLAQMLGALHTFSKVAAAKLANGDLAGADLALREVGAITGQAFDEVRQSIFGLRTMVSRGLGLIPAIAEYLHEFSDRSGIPVRLEVDQGVTVRLSPEVEAQLIRIVQEALSNVWRHAKATQATVRFSGGDGSVHVTIEDDGVGFAVASLPTSAHFGLQTMRERAESAGGTLKVESTPGLGTRVLARLPVDRFAPAPQAPMEMP
jgi:two-component system nitrate/nitrite sensor histidine kinase NarX